MKKSETELVKKCIELHIAIAKDVSEERASKFGYDIMNGLLEGNAHDRFDAWLDWYHYNQDGGSTEEQRNGVWVPAIPL